MNWQTLGYLVTAVIDVLGVTRVFKIINKMSFRARQSVNGNAVAALAKLLS